MTPTARSRVFAGGLSTLALGLLTACAHVPAGSGGVVGHLSGTSDVAGQPGGHALGGGGLAILPIAVMDGPFWELTGAEPLANPQEWAYLGVTLSKSDVSELRGTVTPIEDEGDFRITAQPGEYAICYWPEGLGGWVSGCSDLELPREGELVASWGEGGFNVTVME